MIKTPLVSVIIPTKNEQTNIKRLLKSIKEQSYPKEKIEVIVVDNYSQDKTRKLAKKYTDKVFKKGNERSAQRNYGAKKSKGQILLFLDADMKLNPKTIEEVVEIIDNKKKVIASIPERGMGKTFWEKVLTLERSCYYSETDMQAARAFPKKLFNSIKGYDTTMFAGEDWDITLRAINIGTRLYHTKTPICHYEKAKDLREIIKKDNYYVGNIHLFAKKHPKHFRRVASLRYRGGLFIKNYKLLIRYPVHTLALFFYKLLIHLWSRPHWYKDNK